MKGREGGHTPLGTRRFREMETHTPLHVATTVEKHVREEEEEKASIGFGGGSSEGAEAAMPPRRWRTTCMGKQSSKKHISTASGHDISSSDHEARLFVYERGAAAIASAWTLFCVDV